MFFCSTSFPAKLNFRNRMATCLLILKIDFFTVFTGKILTGEESEQTFKLFKIKQVVSFSSMQKYFIKYVFGGFKLIHSLETFLTKEYSRIKYRKCWKIHYIKGWQKVMYIELLVLCLFTILVDHCYMKNNILLTTFWKDNYLIKYTTENFEKR